MFCLIPVTPWILMIMLSVGPFNNNYNGENDVWYHIVVPGQEVCEQAAKDVMRTHRIFQELNPELRMSAICREDLLMQVPYSESESNKVIMDPEPDRINYRQCLDLQIIQEK